MALSDKAKAMLRSKLPEVKILIIDEISMVSRNLFYKAHAIVLEIFTPPTLIPFAGLSIAILGDFLQLPSVRGKSKYALVSDHERMEGFLKLDLWNVFKFVELTGIMRQTRDTELIELLNKIRLGNGMNQYKNL